MNRNEVELLVDHSNESKKAREILYSLDKRIEVSGIPANGESLPIAFWNGFTYRGVKAIEGLRKRLERDIDQGKL